MALVWSTTGRRLTSIEAAEGERQLKVLELKQTHSTEERALTFLYPLIMSTENKFYACEPHYWLFLTKFQRRLLGWLTLELFVLSFFALPACIVFFIPWFWTSYPWIATAFFGAVLTSMLLPRKEW